MGGFRHVRGRFREQVPAEAGFTLVEVIAAMVVFLVVWVIHHQINHLLILKMLPYQTQLRQCKIDHRHDETDESKQSYQDLEQQIL